MALSPVIVLPLIGRLTFMLRTFTSEMTRLATVEALAVAAAAVGVRGCRIGLHDGLLVREDLRGDVRMR